MIGNQRHAGTGVSGRVCLVSESFCPVVGGMERQARMLVEGLAATGAPPVIVTLRNRPGLTELDHLDGYDVHRVGQPHGRGARWRALGATYRRLVSLRRQYDLIYVDGFRTLGLPAMLAARRLGVPVVLKAENNGELSGAFFDPGLKRVHLTHRSWPLRPMNLARQRVLRGATHFVALSSAARREFVRAGVSPARITIIPNAVDTARFHPATPGERMALRSTLDLPTNARIAVFVGRLITWKGPLPLVDAWGACVRGAASTTAPPLLLFAGGGGADLDNCEIAVRHRVSELGLGAHVRFLGDVPNVEDYLRAADVFVLPTENDSFAMAVVEAMACALPVVTTQVAGLADYVVPEENALAVPPGDTGALGVALHRALHDPALRARLGHAALVTSVRFDRQHILDGHIALFREILEGGEGRRPARAA